MYWIISFITAVTLSYQKKNIYEVLSEIISSVMSEAENIQWQHLCSEGNVVMNQSTLKPL